MNFAGLNNRHAGATILLVGSGPSLDWFNFDAFEDCPRVLVNHALRVSPILPDQSYWIYGDAQERIDPEWRVNLPAGVWEVLPCRLNHRAGSDPAPRGKRVVTFTRATGNGILCSSRAAIAHHGILYEFCGTATMAAHLAWYLGAVRVVLVGIDGTAGRASCVQGFYRYQGAESQGYDRIRKSVLNVLKANGLTFDDYSAPMP